MTPMNPDPGSPPPTSEVWPPPPTNSMPSAPDDPMLSALESFRVQSVWLVLFLTVITLGIYAVFWMRRQSAMVNTLRPDLKLSLAYANVVLVFAFLSAGVDVASWINAAPSLETAANGGDRILGIMALLLSFQVRNGFNQLLRLQKSDPYWFAGVYTWFFGAIYLQYKINKNIQRRQNESRLSVTS